MNADKPPGERKPNSNIPNSYQTPNYFVDALMHLLTPPENVVLSFMSRHIFGWDSKIERREANISLNMFMNGFTSKDGQRFNGTGLGRNAIISATDALTSFGIVEAVGDAGPDGQLWRFPPDDRDVKYEKLERRKQDAHATNTKRSAAARQKRQEQKRTTDGAGLSDKPLTTGPESAPPFVGQTTTSLSDKPEGDLSDKPKGVCPTNGIKPIDKPTEETHEETHVPRDASARAPIPDPIAPLMASLAPLVDAPTLTEPPAPTPPVSAPPPAPPRDAEPTPAGDIFYVTADGAHYGPFTSYNAVKAEVSARGFKQVAVTQTRPDGELIAPDKPGRKLRKPKADGPRLEQPPADVKDAFALLCYNGTAITGASWARLIKAWNRLEKPPAEKFATFTRWWKACDWRGVKGQRPTPEQVVSEWDVAQNWDGATPVAVTPYQQNYRSKAELDAERNRINIEKGMEKARQWQAEREAKRGKS